MVLHHPATGVLTKATNSVHTGRGVLEPLLPEALREASIAQEQLLAGVQGRARTAVAFGVAERLGLTGAMLGAADLEWMQLYIALFYNYADTPRTITNGQETQQYEAALTEHVQEVLAANQITTPDDLIRFTRNLLVPELAGAGAAAGASAAAGSTRP